MSLDKASFGGLILALGGVLAGLLLEGGNLGQILQPTAAMIVFGGTLGAVLLQFPLAIILLAFRQLGSVFVNPERNQQAAIHQLVQYAQKARREGKVEPALFEMSQREGLVATLASEEVVHAERSLLIPLLAGSAGDDRRLRATNHTST